MNTRFPGSQRAAGQRGAASIVVLIMLFIMMAFIMGNSVALHNLKREIRRVEERQLRRWGMSPRTNVPLRAVASPST